MVSAAGLGGQPFLECLLESLDFSAGGWVVGSGVLLFDAQGGEAGFEGVGGRRGRPSSGWCRPWRCR